VELPVSAPAERNKQPILDELLKLLPGTGAVLEIASGTGQHVVHFAAAMSAIRWQPTDPDIANVATEARCQASGLKNIEPALQLDVLIHPWPVAPAFDAILCINMIHISPWQTTAALFAGAGRALSAKGAGLVVMYGPYKEGGQHTAPSNLDFDRWLKSRDELWGVRDLESVEATALAAGFQRRHLARMPANNLLLAFSRL
jgi:cyclopropane fatty-acyl-phospholipid synthase-like methyltransferase